MTGFVCATCGEFHDELPMCLGAPAPALWSALPEAERAMRGELTSDQCIIDDKYFFVLGRILLPVLGSKEHFVWLAWVSLSEANFMRSCELWETEGRENEPACFGWLQSDFPYQPSTLGLATSVQTMPVGERPLIRIQATDHPLFYEQQEGITRQRVQQWVEAAWHGA